jgi:hypothetical protein
MTLTQGGRTWHGDGWASAGGRAATASCRPRTPAGPGAADPTSGALVGSSLHTEKTREEINFRHVIGCRGSNSHQTKQINVTRRGRSRPRMYSADRTGGQGGQARCCKTVVWPYAGGGKYHVPYVGLGLTRYA